MSSDLEEQQAIEGKRRRSCGRDDRRGCSTAQDSEQLVGVCLPCQASQLLKLPQNKYIAAKQVRKVQHASHGMVSMALAMSHLRTCCGGRR